MFKKQTFSTIWGFWAVLSLRVRVPDVAAGLAYGCHQSCRPANPEPLLSPKPQTPNP